MDAKELVEQLADRARLAARTLSIASGLEREAALLAIADVLEERSNET
jgi:glutamate-5-semialdehyde dehydrogenase